MMIVAFWIRIMVTCSSYSNWFILGKYYFPFDLYTLKISFIKLHFLKVETDVSFKKYKLFACWVISIHFKDAFILIIESNDVYWRQTANRLISVFHTFTMIIPISCDIGSDINNKYSVLLIPFYLNLWFYNIDRKSQFLRIRVPKS